MASSFINPSNHDVSVSTCIPTNRRAPSTIKLSNGTDGSDTVSATVRGTGTGEEKAITDGSVMRTPPFHMNGNWNGNGNGAAHNHHNHHCNSSVAITPFPVVLVQPQLQPQPQPQLVKQHTATGSSSLSLMDNFKGKSHGEEQYNMYNNSKLARQLSAESATFISPSLLSAAAPTVTVSSTFTTQTDQQQQQQQQQHLTSTASQQPQSYWNNVTALTMMDILHTLVAKSVPQNLVRRQFRRRRRKLLRLQQDKHLDDDDDDMHMRHCLLLPSSVRSNTIGTTYSAKKVKTLKPTKTARGISNYGQTCFLNSILQALASLEPFILYLERLQNADLDKSNNNANNAYDGGASTKNNPSMLNLLSRLLYTINGQLEEGRPVDPRSLLHKIGSNHKQFRRNSEQQDAQELLQALMDMLVMESDVSVVATAGDSLLSLSSFLTQIDLHQREERRQHKEKQIQETTTTIDREAQEQIQRIKLSQQNSNNINQNINNNNNISMVVDQEVDGGEEKKQEASVESIAILEKPVGDNALESSSMLILDGDDDDDDLKQEASSSNAIFDSISENTPSPLNGWIGSTLQCMCCQHVRPIQNAPFLDIPIVPTSISTYLNGACYSNQPSKDNPSSRYPSCRVTTCLENFTAIEKVTDVECRQCTINEQIELWEDEVFMLQGAVDSLQARSKLKAGSGVQADTWNAKAHLERLRHMDADEVDTVPAGPNALDTDATITTIPLCRGDALKCLLLTRLPTVICLHIQRRYYDPRLDKNTKTIQHVAFDEFMDLGRFCAYSGDDKGMTGSGDRQARQQHRAVLMYKLMSVIEHRGNAFSGHYVAYRRDLANPTNWLFISDECVRTVLWRDVEASQAYMLFYEAMEAM